MIGLTPFAQDVGFALRMLRRMPAFTATIILTLALGIGMTSAVFSVFNTVLLKPLSYPNPERLVSISTVEPDSPHTVEIVLEPHFTAWKAQSSTFEHLVAYDMSDEPVILGGQATRERVAMVSEGFWELSRVRLAHGRVPASGDEDTLLVSHHFFEARLRGDAAAIGRSITVDGRALTVVGVLPREFLFQVPWPGWPGFEPHEVAAYRTVRIEPATGNMIQLLNVIGKVKPGVTIEQARAELDTIRARVASERPRFPGNDHIVRVEPLGEKLGLESRLSLTVLLAAVAFVLLIACANVASLLYGRGSSRQKEMAIRAAVGAGRARLLRQLSLESLMLAVAGGAAGLLLADWSLSLIVTLVPYAIPRLTESSIDRTVLVFTAGVSIVTAFVFGAGPALTLGAVNLQDSLRLGAKPSSSTSMNPRAGRLLIAVEMALAVVLLTGAALMIKSFWRLNAHPPGFEPARVLTMKVQFSGPQYDEDSRRAYVDEFLRRVQSVAGVSAAGITSHGDTITVAIVEGAPKRSPEEQMQRSSVLMNAVSAGSARALGLRVLRGRWISDTEPPTNVVINESLARRDFSGQDPIGRRIRLDSDETPFATIVGVVADLKYTKLDERPEPEVYVPYARGTPGRFTAAVRTSIDPVALAPAVRESLADIDRTLPVFDVQTLEQALADSIAPRRFNLFVLAVFAAVALGLAMTGVYGVIAYSVAQRTHEIGIRMAIGADRRDVVAMVVRQGVGTALAGIAVGIAAATLLTRLMASLLYEVEATDPQAFVVAAAALTVVALTASILPALAAARIDPAETLR